MVYQNPYFQRAIDYIRHNDLATLPNGHHIIDGDNIWVNIVDTELHPIKAAVFEAHNKYIDIHIPLSASESYGVKERNECEHPIGMFNENDDFICFADAITTIVLKKPGEMIVFTPEDAHAPLIGEGKIRKAILKVKTEEVFLHNVQSK